MCVLICVPLFMLKLLMVPKLCVMAPLAVLETRQRSQGILAVHVVHTVHVAHMGSHDQWPSGSKEPPVEKAQDPLPYAPPQMVRIYKSGCCFVSWQHQTSWPP